VVRQLLLSAVFCGSGAARHKPAAAAPPPATTRSAPHRLRAPAHSEPSGQGSATARPSRPSRRFPCYATATLPRSAGSAPAQYATTAARRRTGVWPTSLAPTPSLDDQLGDGHVLPYGVTTQVVVGQRRYRLDVRRPRLRRPHAAALGLLEIGGLSPQTRDPRPVPLNPLRPNRESRRSLGTRPAKQAVRGRRPLWVTLVANRTIQRLSGTARVHVRGVAITARHPSIDAALTLDRCCGEQHRRPEHRVRHSSRRRHG
jgi:hypothetical protein